jgi:hypothetical protein
LNDQMIDSEHMEEERYKHLLTTQATEASKSQN